MSAPWSGKIYKQSTQPGGGSGYYCWIDATEIGQPYEFRDETHGTLNVGGMRLERGPVGPGVFSNQITVSATAFNQFQNFDLAIRFQGEGGGESTFPIRFDTREYTYQEVFGGAAPVPVPVPDPQPPPVVDPPPVPVPDVPLTLPAAPTSTGELLEWASKLTEYLASQGF